jgi:hypothetical protein
MAGETMSAVGLIFTLILSVFILLLSRKYAFVPVFVGACFMTIGQYLLIGPFHFYVLRLLLSVAWIRIFMKKEFEGWWFNSIDKMVIVWGIVAVITGTVQDMSRMVEGLVNSLGWCYDALGSYFIFRIMINNRDDIRRAVRAIAFIFIPLGIAMLIEKKTGHNPFSVLGGVPEFSQIRDGALRAQGPFLHPILAGTAAATTIPLLVSIWWTPQRGRILAATGVIAALAIVASCSSSGPALTVLVILTALAVWFFRNHMKIVRSGIIISIVALQLVMKAPFWHIIGKIGNQTGGTGYHRSQLIDSAIAHFGEWWLVGTTYTRHWMVTGVTWSPNHTDITSQYIAQGVMGGAGLLLLFILIIVKAFRMLGTAMISLPDDRVPDKILLWAMGASLVGHVASFVSVSYFDQTITFYYLLIAMISTSSYCFFEDPDPVDDEPAVS